MSLEKDGVPKIQFPLKGCKKIDNVVYIPLPELINLLRRFSMYTGKHFAQLLEHAIWNEPENQPTEFKKKSFISRLFGKRNLRES